MDTINIFLMGCWNKNTCIEDKNLDRREHVLSLISENTTNFDFSILLGDNIYPLKNKKIKTKKNKKGRKKTKKYMRESGEFYRNYLSLVESMTIDSPFDLKLHVILGNHDVYYDCVKRHQIDQFTTPISNIYERNTMFSTDLANFIFLNSNNMSEVLDYLEDLDVSTLEDKWLILCAHEPLISYKPKKKRIFQKLNESKNVFEILKRIRHHKIAYFCADTHNFQVLEMIEPNYGNSVSNSNYFSLPIIVVGTGGAKPDSLKGIEDNLEYYEENDDVHVSIIDYQDCYGYASLQITKNELRVNYIRCESENNLIIKYLPRKNMLTYKSSILEKTCDYRDMPKCDVKSLKEFDTIC